MRHRPPDHIGSRMCGLFCTAQPLEEGLLGPSAVRSGAKAVMVQCNGRGNGEKDMSAYDPIVLKNPALRQALARA